MSNNISALNLQFLLWKGDDIKSSIESLSEQYGVPISELEELVTMSRLAGRMEVSLEIGEAFLNDFKETEGD